MMRLVVLLSGDGSNLQALIDAIAAKTLDAEIVAVLANHPSAFGLVRAAESRIPTRTLCHADYRRSGRSRSDYDAALADLLAPFEPDLVVLAGWMRILTATFLDRLSGRVINLHPALPGQFPGTRAIERAYAAFGRGEIARTGVMVHWVIPAVDAGEPIATTEVPILDGDSLDALTARVHAAEHALLVSAIATLARGLAYGSQSSDGVAATARPAEARSTR